MSNTSTHSTTRRLTEGGICIALGIGAAADFDP